VGQPSTPEIGGTLKAIRRQRKLTLDQLAKASGVSKSMLSQIERGRANPTVATLWNLTRALGVEINDLIATAAPSAAEITHIKAHQTPEIRSADGRCRLRILSSIDTASRVEWYEIHVQPGGVLASDGHGPGTGEHLTVLDGCLEVETARQTLCVKAGETVRYGADVAHSIYNKSEKTAVALLVDLVEGH